jgi:predicted Zn-ribbon and HTH transcriptional regulator
MNRIPVALFATRSQAEPVQQRLVLAGIAAEIHEELGLQRFWFVSKRSAGTRLEVAAHQFEEAVRLLAGWDTTQGALARAMHCPKCKSLRVDYPQFAHNSVLTNMAAGLAAELGLVEKDYYCEQCHYTWPKERADVPHERPHMAPYYFIEDVGNVTSATMPQQTSDTAARFKAV